jgi:hypothetical protein
VGFKQLGGMLVAGAILLACQPRDPQVIVRELAKLGSAKIGTEVQARIAEKTLQVVVFQEEPVASDLSPFGINYISLIHMNKINQFVKKMLLVIGDEIDFFELTIYSKADGNRVTTWEYVRDIEMEQMFSPAERMGLSSVAFSGRSVVELEPWADVPVEDSEGQWLLPMNREGFLKRLLKQRLRSEFPFANVDVEVDIATNLAVLRVLRMPLLAEFGRDPSFEFANQMVKVGIDVLRIYEFGVNHLEIYGKEGQLLEARNL